MINYFLVVFGNKSQISEDLTILIGDDIVKMVEGDSVILATLKSNDTIEVIKEKIKEIKSPFIVIHKNQFKEIALHLDDDTLKYLFNTKEKKVKKPKEDVVTLDLNTILDKINKNGINSLRKEEQDFLKKFSH